MSALPYLMRIEGVNLGRFVFDTRDLSTIRGGGLMLLEAVDTACAALEKFTAPLKVKTISQGASIGLFKFDLPSNKTPADAESNVRAALASKYPQATFVVDAVPAATGPFREDAEKLLARNRWRQMQSATLLAPGAVDDPPDFVPACEIDGVRPARNGHRGRKPDTLMERKSATFLSDATETRREFGKKEKQRFYAKQLRTANLELVQLEHEFASEFEHIAQRKAKPLEGKPLDEKSLQGEPLDGKLAVFYADGNQFGAIQRKLCDSPERQAAWDHYIRTERAKFLRAFLEEELVNAPDGWVFRDKSESFYRFETLLWGGDELLFVMPAWKGWQFAARFFQATAGWNASAAKLEDGSHLGEQPLTHTAALVFCQHHAPIHRIKDLAKEKMAESAKGIKEGSKLIGRERNQLVYQVLESVDHLGSDYESALAERYRKEAKLADLVLADGGSNAFTLAEKLAAVASAVGELRAGDFPRSQLRALVHDWLHHTEVKSFEEALKVFARTAADCKKPLESLSAQLGSDLPLWLHLEELWDYAAP